MPTMYPVVVGVPASSVIQFTTRCWQNDQVGLNIWWYFTDNPILDVSILLHDWQIIANGALVTALNQTANYNDCIVRFNTGTGWSEYFFSVPDPTGGAGGSVPLPSQCCGIITRRVDLLGPRNRGRLYIPFPSTDDVDPDEHPKDAYVATLNAIAAAVLPTSAALTVGTATLIPGLCSAGGDPGEWHPLLEIGAQQKWGTQHRRGDYGRGNT